MYLLNLLLYNTYLLLNKCNLISHCLDHNNNQGMNTLNFLLSKLNKQSYLILFHMRILLMGIHSYNCYSLNQMYMGYPQAIHKINNYLYSLCLNNSIHYMILQFMPCIHPHQINNINFMFKH